MSDVVIQVDSLWKKYRLGVLGTGTLRHDFNRWLHRTLGKPDPYAKVGEVQKAEKLKTETLKAEKDASISAFQRVSMSASQDVSVSASQDVSISALSEDEMWALRDVSFEVKRGEILGIIGRNGAGKSTLLKILSRVTAPTSGEVRVKGRIASLLEVGTGFHPELTGRENIFLNGAILGMSKAEIRKKFDEIVAFSEVEKYIDTPVKRYSSGMYVRLAFAVAAHLDPEILIVDEVLAVGDASFQKKCLGKMGDVSRAGRTILFVSHNMVAVRSLCTRTLVLRDGKLAFEGATEEAVSAYLSQDFRASLERRWVNAAEAPQGGGYRVMEARLVPCGQTESGRMTIENAFDLVFCLWSDKPARTNLSLHFMTPAGEIGFAVASPCVNVPIGQTAFRCHVPANLLNDGNYTIELLVVECSKAQVVVKDALTFEIDDRARTGAWMGKWPGFVRPHLSWDYEHLADNAKA